MTTAAHSLSSLGPMHPRKIAGVRANEVNAHHVAISVRDPLDHEAPAILHEPRDYDASMTKHAAVILISGAGGGVSGPSGIYPSLADKLALLIGIPVIRLDYRAPAKVQYCVPDVVATMDYLEDYYQCSRFVMVGWSFGGSPCFTVAAQEPERICGVATVASQTANTTGISKLSPRPLLLLHGSGDTCLSPSCSETLYQKYGPHGQRELKIFDGDNHGLTSNAPEAEALLFVFAAKTLGFEDELTTASIRISGQDWAGSVGERVKEMKQGHDLEGNEALNY
ncbi:Alpha/Beta hydrolase protein [Aspergillus californicus]